MLYDKLGITPFIELPRFSYFGEYQIMFDLYPNFVAKVGGKAEYGKATCKQNRTFFLCIKKKIFLELLEQHTKSKIILQKRALKRRMVFLDHFDKMEEFLVIKRKKNQRLLDETFNRKTKTVIVSEAAGPNSPGLTPSLSDGDNTSQEGDDSLDDGGEYVESINQEQKAKEELRSKLTDFRKEELVAPLESEDEGEWLNEKENEFETKGITDVNFEVENMEKKIDKISTTIKNIDRRMS